MVIVELDVAHFGKLKNRNVVLRPGMNVITGENESGKSTIAAFIRYMIYGAAYEDVRKYEPYEKDGVFGGKMRVLISGAFYEIERSFAKGAESLQVVKESDDTVVEDPQRFLTEAMNGLTPEEYDETGFAAQNFFLQDMQRLKETPEKRQKQEREAQISEELHGAKEALLERKASTDEKLKNLKNGEAEEIRSELGKTDGEIDRLGREYPELLKTIRRLRETYQQEIERKSEDRRNTEDALREDMIERKQELEEHTKDAGGKIRKNTVGVLLMTLALLLAAATYFYMCSEEIELSLQPSSYPVIGGFAAAFLLFVIGIIVTSVRVSRNRRILTENGQAEQYRKNAEEAEQRYRKYMKEQNDNAGQPETDDGHEEEIRELTRQADEMQAELQNRSEQRERLSEMNRKIEADSCDADALRREQEVLRIALQAFEDTESTEKANAAFSASASRYLNGLDPRKLSRICGDGGYITVESGGTSVPLEQLSLSAAIEVLLAVRMARFEEMDANKTVPMILDDVLSGLDSERVKSSMGVLRSLGRQVILLSCQERERKAL